MVSGQWRSLWIDVEIPEDIQAGEYPLEIRLTHGEDLIGKLEVFCEVIDRCFQNFQFRVQNGFIQTVLQTTINWKIFSDEYWEVVENFVKTAVKRNCNMLLTPVFTPPLDTAVGGERRTVQLVDVKAEGNQYTFGFANFEKWVSMCQRCGIEYYAISTFVLPVGSSCSAEDCRRERMGNW